MQEMQIFNNPDFGEIRTMIIDDEPWFVSKDISDKLGYAKPANMVKLVDDDDKRNVRSSDLEPSSKGTVYQVSMINESGLYAAIFGSKQENAKKFKSRQFGVELTEDFVSVPEWEQISFPLKADSMNAI